MKSNAQPAKSLLTIFITAYYVAFATACSELEVSKRTESTNKNKAESQNKEAISQDPSVQALNEAQLALLEESDRLATSAKNLPQDQNQRMGLSDESPNAMIENSAAQLKIAADNLAKNLSDVKTHVNNTVSRDASGNMKIPSIERNIADAKALNDRVLSDAMTLANTKGGASSMLADLDKKMDAHNTAYAPLINDLNKEGAPLLEAGLKSIDDAKKYSEIVHLRNFSYQEAANLEKNLTDMSMIINAQSAKYGSLSGRVSRFRELYRLDAPLDSVQRIKSALASYTKSKAAIETSAQGISKVRGEFSNNVREFEILVSKAKEANTSLGNIFDEIRMGPAQGILKEVSKLRGAAGIIADLVTNEKREDVRQSLVNVKVILDSAIDRLSKVSDNLTSAMTKATDVLASQNAVITDQTRLTALQEQYIKSLEDEQNRLVERLKNSDIYNEVSSIVSGLEDWAMRAKTVADTHEAAIKASIEPIVKALGPNLIYDLSDDASNLVYDIREARSSEKKNLRLLRVADVAKFSDGLVSVGYRQGTIRLQTETRSADRKTRSLEEAKSIASTNGSVRDLIVRADSAGSRAAVRYAEINGEKQSLNILLGDVNAPKSSWIKVTVSENYARQSNLAIDSIGRTAIVWRELDGKSFMQLFDAMGGSVGERSALHEFSVNGKQCNSYVNINLSVTGDLGIVSCLYRQSEAGEESFATLFRRFLKSGEWLDKTALLSQEVPTGGMSLNRPKTLTTTTIAATGEFVAGGAMYDKDGKKKQSINEFLSFDGFSEGKSFDNVTTEDESRFLIQEGKIVGIHAQRRQTKKSADPGYDNIYKNSRFQSFINQAVAFAGPGYVERVSMPDTPLKLALNLDKASNYTVSGSNYAACEAGSLATARCLKPLYFENTPVPAEIDRFETLGGRLRDWSFRSSIDVDFIRNITKVQTCGGFAPFVQPFKIGSEVASCNGEYRLKLNEDGTLAHYRGDKMLWSSGDIRGSTLKFAGSYNTISLVDDTGKIKPLVSDSARVNGAQIVTVTDNGLIAVFSGYSFMPLYINEAFQSRLVK
jgi:hypothetical protein